MTPDRPSDLTHLECDAGVVKDAVVVYVHQIAAIQSCREENNQSWVLLSASGSILTCPDPHEEHGSDVDALDVEELHRVDGSNREGCRLFVRVVQLVEVLQSQ